MAKKIMTRVKAFFELLSHSDWVSITGSIGSAAIAAVISLLVVYLQANQQEQKEDKQQDLAEQNKLKYLQFLMSDTYRLLETYDHAVQNFTASVSNNPFIIPDLQTFPPYSLNIIANKINQEEYYLASVNQFKNEDIAEVFKLCNYLYSNYTSSVNHYRTEFPGLASDKEKYIANYKKLIEDTNQYLIATNNTVTSPVEVAINREINGVMSQLKNKRQTRDFMTELRDSKDQFARRIGDILNPRGEIKYRSLMREAYALVEEYDHYYNYIKNVNNSLEANRLRHQDLRNRIQKFYEPLETYVNRRRSTR